MKKMLSRIDFSKDLILIELGPGTGVFTKEILKRMSAKSRLICFEINPVFHHNLSNKFKDSRLSLVFDSAENIQKYLSNDTQKVDGVISSLPLAVIPIRVKINILNTKKEILSTDSYFIQFQYTVNAKKILEAKFNKVTIEFTPLNIPPAFIYFCEN